MEAAGNGRIVTSFTANVEHINLNQTNPYEEPRSEFGPDGSNEPVLLRERGSPRRAVAGDQP